MLSKRFQSGKYAGKTYSEVWHQDQDYFYYLASQFDYWADVVKTFERLRLPTLKKNSKTPSTSDLKQFFTTHLIHNYDMSNYIANIYEPLNEQQKHDYLTSLLKRNKLFFPNFK